VTELAAWPGDGPVLVVTHAGPIRAAISHACGIAWASTWAMRIGYATRIRLNLGLTPEGEVWGEIIEIVQP
jgi:alpha-ribazole phosphatase